ncbi:MAG: GAF domain-containing protein, partial [Anaerolineae bacterium]|nr:GAF domain-containing protein [Anaerolineae bacterium]
QLRAVTGTSEQINTSLDLDEELADAMDNVIALTGAERGYIVLTNPNPFGEEELEFRIARDPEQMDKQGRVTFQGSRTILSEVLQTGQPLLTDNAYNDPRMQDNFTVARLGLRSVVCVPLKIKDRVIGAVYVDNRLRAGIFTKREVTLLSAFANQASVAIENARLFTRVQTSIVTITELKELMGSVFDSIGSGVITSNADHTITTFNRAAARILGVSVDQAVGQPLQSLIPKINVDFGAILHSVMEQNQSVTVDAEVDSPVRERIALKMKLSPLKDANHTTQGVAMVLEDLTEQRQNEQMLDTMRRYLTPEMVDNIQSIATLALGGERREVTCMFVEVRPLSTFPPGLGPEQIMKMLNRHLTVASNCILAGGGVIDKYMGHEVMVLFNSQLNPHPHHSMLAVEVALSMRDGFLALYRELGIDPNPHYYRMGMHTGVATLGNVGSLNRRDFTAIGDTINLSKRLEENATAGQIIISEDLLNHIAATVGALPPELNFQERDAIQVKGRQQRTRIYEVFRANA